MNMVEIFNNIFEPIKKIFYSLFLVITVTAFSTIVLFLAVFLIKYRINVFRLKPEKLLKLDIKFKPYDMLRYLLIDFISVKKHDFDEFGFTFFVGRQGAGKTISMVNYLNRIKKECPKCMIVTNFQYSQADHILTDWNDFLHIRNGVDGVIFAIDEIHSEYSSNAWKDFPENLLSEISQQRKQRVKIVATAQVFSRVAKPLREQAFTVVSCSTMLHRFTKNVEYDANDYAICVDKLFKLKEKCRPVKKLSFVQSDYLRSCYDTFEKIERMKKIKEVGDGFMTRNFK